MLRTRNEKRNDGLEHIHRYFHERMDIDGDDGSGIVITVSPESIRMTCMMGGSAVCMKSVAPGQMLDILAGMDCALYGQALDALEQARRGDTVNIIHYPGSGVIHAEAFRKGRVPKGWADRYAEEYLDTELWEETA